MVKVTFTQPLCFRDKSGSHVGEGPPCDGTSNRGDVQRQNLGGVSTPHEDKGDNHSHQKGEIRQSTEEKESYKSICPEKVAPDEQDSAVSSTVSEILLDFNNEFSCTVESTLDVPPNFFDTPNLDIIPLAEAQSVKEARPFIPSEGAQIVFRYDESVSSCEKCMGSLTPADNKICNNCILSLKHDELIKLIDDLME